MDMYSVNQHKLEKCICDNHKLPCTCGYMDSEYKKGGNEIIGLINELTKRLSRVEDAMGMLLLEIKKNIPDLDISTYEKILEEDRT